MAILFNTIKGRSQAVVSMAAVFVTAMATSLASGGTPEDVTEAAKTKVIASLKADGIYDRHIDPEEANIELRNVKGYYDAIGGAYRYITNEYEKGFPLVIRAGRDEAPEIKPGDSISFYFDARVLSGSWGNSINATYWTNMSGRITAIRNNNPEFDTSGWSTGKMRIKVGDGNILKAIDKALPSCRLAGQREVEVTNGDGETELVTENIAADEVRIYLLPDAAYGNKGLGIVPPKSTVVWELTEIQIIEPNNTPE